MTRFTADFLPLKSFRDIHIFTARQAIGVLAERRG